MDDMAQVTRVRAVAVGIGIGLTLLRPVRKSRR